MSTTSLTGINGCWQQGKQQALMTSARATKRKTVMYKNTFVVHVNYNLHTNSSVLHIIYDTKTQKKILFVWHDAKTMVFRANKNKRANERLN